MNKHTTIWTEIDAWASGLRPWERFLLATLVRERRVDESALAAVEALLLKEHGLAKAAELQLAEGVTVSEDITGRPAVVHRQVYVTRISGTRSVNALPDDSELPFSRELTIVYGQNGTGKSGFFRVLAALCFARSSSAVLPDVFADGGESAPVAARVEFQYEDGELSQCAYPASGPHPDLRRVTVFDSAVAAAHVAKSNEFSYTPAGFDVFDGMEAAFAELRNRLQARINNIPTSHTFDRLFVSNVLTPAQEAIRSLSARSEVKTLRALGTFGADEKALFAGLSRDLDDLRTKSPEQLLKAARQSRADIEGLKQQLEQLQAGFSPSVVEDLNRLVRVLAKNESLASQESVEQLARESLDVGSDAWQAFAASARAFAPEGYPLETDPCLLCQRPLDPPSASVIRATWAYLSGEARKAADQTKARLVEKISSLRGLNFGVFPEASRVRAHLGESAPELASRLASALSELSAARDAACLAAAAGETYDRTPPWPVLLPDLDAQLGSLEARIASLEKNDVDSVIEGKKAEYSGLRHREVLAANLEAVVHWVEQQRWREAAEKLISTALNTAKLTRKQKALAIQLVGDEYLTRLKNELEALDCGHLEVVPTIRGDRGTTVRRFALRDARSSLIDVLSEGEQRVLALADFLAEVGLNPAGAGIVLDDPVSSLDQERKEKIAARLALEATRRQVIVFTHDMEFLTLLAEAAKSHDGLDVSTHWVQRGGQPSAPGLISLDDGPLTESAFKSSDLARRFLKTAVETAGHRRSEALRQGFGALRTAYERLVLRKLLQDLVSPYRRHVKMGMLSRVVWADALVARIQREWEALSGYIDAHFRPDGTVGSEPTTRSLQKFCDTFDELSAEIRRSEKRQP